MRPHSSEYALMFGSASTDLDAANRRPVWRTFSAVALAVGLVGLTGVICTGKPTRRFVAPVGSVWLAEHATNEKRTDSPADAVEAAVKKAHNALKHQRFSIEVPFVGDLPTEVAQSMNFSTDPCSNFYEYACGSWVRDTRIPVDKASWSRTWDGTQRTVDAHLHSVITAEWPVESQYRRLSDWYDACMDIDTVNALGNEPLQFMLQRIDALETVEQLQELFVELIGTGAGPKPFHASITLGFRDKEHNALFLSGAGLTMPDPGWYDVSYNKSNKVMGSSNDFDESYHREARRHVLDYMRTLNELAGSSSEEATHIAEQSLALETMLAQWRVDEPLIDDPLGPELTSLSNLTNLCPGMPWTQIFENISEGCREFNYTCNEKLLADEKVIIVTAPYFFGKLSDSLLDESMLNTSWKPFLRTHYIGMCLTVLDDNFLQAKQMLERWASGTPEMISRKEKCVGETQAALSALTDMAFIDQFFPEDAQRASWTLLNYIKDAFFEKLSTVEWMDAETRKNALHKVEKLGLNVGGPREYQQLVYEVSNSTYFDNARRALRCHTLREYMELGKSPNNSVWILPAHTVNAWYDNGLNALFIPAGIMQPPFFSIEYPEAQNFGSMGMLMAHEMTHGFDTTGSRFDEDRALNEWWSAPVRQQFQTRAHCIRHLYDRFVIAGKNVKGRKTLAENIADFGGLQVAYLAYLSWYNSSTGGEPPEDAKRLFFTAFGQNWCAKERPQNLKMAVLNDAHAPWAFRANGPVSQNLDFARVFNCPKGAPMNPFNRCAMWSQPSTAASGLSIHTPGLPERGTLRASAARGEAFTTAWQRFEQMRLLRWGTATGSDTQHLVKEGVLPLAPLAQGAAWDF